jgi:hypothetical protein
LILLLKRSKHGEITTSFYQLKHPSVNCYSWLKETKDAKKQKVKELQAEIEAIDDARDLVQLMEESQGMLDHLETRAKKQKI